MREIGWPEYPATTQKEAGLTLALTVAMPVLVCTIFFALRIPFELRHEPVPCPVSLGALLAIVVIVVSTPLVYWWVTSTVLRRARIGPEGVELRAPRRNVKSSEIRRAVVSGSEVILELTDGEELEVQVLDPEGFAETLRERWGVEVAKG
ncbi:hypothetical protein [Methanopyrus sp.]